MTHSFCFDTNVEAKNAMSRPHRFCFICLVSLFLLAPSGCGDSEGSGTNLPNGSSDCPEVELAEVRDDEAFDGECVTVYGYLLMGGMNCDGDGNCGANLLLFEEASYQFDSEVVLVFQDDRSLQCSNLDGPMEEGCDKEPGDYWRAVGIVDWGINSGRLQDVEFSEASP